MHKTVRKEFLDELLEVKTTDKERRAIKMIMKHEETRRTWRTISKGHGKVRMNGVSAVEDKQDSDYITITEQDKVEDAIMENNSKRFQVVFSSLFSF